MWDGPRPQLVSFLEPDLSFKHKSQLWGNYLFNGEEKASENTRRVYTRSLLLPPTSSAKAPKWGGGGAAGPEPLGIFTGALECGQIQKKPPSSGRRVGGEVTAPWSTAGE